MPPLGAHAFQRWSHPSFPTASRRAMRKCADGDKETGRMTYSTALPGNPEKNSYLLQATFCSWQALPLEVEKPRGHERKSERIAGWGDGPSRDAGCARYQASQLSRRAAGNNSPSLAYASGQCDIGPKRERGMASIAAALLARPYLSPVSSRERSIKPREPQP